MRKALTRALVKLAEQDSRVILLTADLGFMVLEPFAERFPQRFFNVGVAEQNMVGIATGLAEAGFIPFVYSIATFVSLRAYEFIRNGPILHQLPVRIAAVGGGFEYSDAGSTHHSLEDIGVMRMQPGITVLAPADHEQAYNAVLSTWDLSGPVYYRLSKDDSTTIKTLNGRFELGRIQTIRQGEHLLMITMGNIAEEALAAAEALSEQGIECEVSMVSSFNPAPVEDLIQTLARFSKVLTVEAHYINGGVGSLVAEVIAEHKLRCQLVRCGVRQSPDGISGRQAFYYQKHGIAREPLTELALGLLNKAHFTRD